MTTYKYPLACSSWDKSEFDAIKKVVNSNKFTMGVKVKEFENKFAKYMRTKHAVMVNSGSSANLLMIASLFYIKNEKYNIKRGDEVIVTSVSWSTTYSPLYHFGLKIKFIDIDIDTLNINTNVLEQAISNKTRLILLVNLLGNPNKFDEISNIVKNKNIIVLEDNCESMGGTYKGKQLGTFGLMGTFSSYYSHHISTIEGGMVVCNNTNLYHILLSLRAHGWTRELPEKNGITKKKSSDKFYELFKFVLPGFNVRPTEINGAIGIEQLKKLNKIIEKRRSNAKYWLERVNEIQTVIPQKEIHKSSWFGFSLVLKNGIERKLLVEELQKKGIESRPIVSGNFTKNKVINYFDYEIFNTLDNANKLHKNGLFIGNSHEDNRKMIDILIGILKKYS